jgi:uncharacterized phage protein gp47/JayE
MNLSLQNFQTMMQTMAASVQGAASSLIDLTVGSVLRALLEANASIALWLQWLIVQVLSATRLATSTGADVDSFGADFGFSRLPAVAASGQVTFSRFTPSVAGLVPVGASVSTSANGQSFSVVSDLTNASYSISQNGYVVTPGIASMNVPVVASVAGISGNVQPGAISMLTSALPGIDTVTNALAMAGGIDAETDSAFRARFSNYLGSLSRATTGAIGSSISAIQQGLSYTISENLAQTGMTQLGHFVVTVDDGSGSPPPNLLATVQQAVEAVRPVGTSYAVQGPVVQPANIEVTIITAAGASHTSAVTAVENAFESYIAGLAMGTTLYYTRLAQLAYDASSSVIGLSGLLLNGATGDLVPPLFGVVRSGTMTVS